MIQLHGRNDKELLTGTLNAGKRGILKLQSQEERRLREKALTPSVSADFYSAATASIDTGLTGSAGCFQPIWRRNFGLAGGCRFSLSPWGQHNRGFTQGCRFEEAVLSRGAWAEVE